MTTENIAQAAHEINRAYCLSLGDNSQPEWKDAPEWQKSSAIKGVEFHLKNPDATPEASHESWMKQKALEGWKYGPVKDTDKKEHPCFQDYSLLPVEQKAKDYLFRQVIHSLAKFHDIAKEDGPEEIPAGGFRKTAVQVKCVSKKEGRHPYGDQRHQHEIELEVPYDTSNIFYQLSGGTNLTLKTINPEAADMFKIDDKYEVQISPVTPVK